MARMIQTTLPKQTQSKAEKQLFITLRSSLDDHFTVFHSFSLLTINKQILRHGSVREVIKDNCKRREMARWRYWVVSPNMKNNERTVEFRKKQILKTSCGHYRLWVLYSTLECRKEKGLPIESLSGIKMAKKYCIDCGRILPPHNIGSR